MSKVDKREHSDRFTSQDTETNERERPPSVVQPAKESAAASVDRDAWKRDVEGQGPSTPRNRSDAIVRLKPVSLGDCSILNSLAEEKKGKQ